MDSLDYCHEDMENGQCLARKKRFSECYTDPQIRLLAR